MRDGTLTQADGAEMKEESYLTIPGNYPAYYAGIRDAILGRGENPVTAEQAIQVMELIELGLRSAREGRRLTPGQLDSVVTTAARQAPANLPVGHRGSEVLRSRPQATRPLPAQSVATGSASASPSIA